MSRSSPMGAMSPIPGADAPEQGQGQPPRSLTDLVGKSPQGPTADDFRSGLKERTVKLEEELLGISRADPSFQKFMSPIMQALRAYRVQLAKQMGNDRSAPRTGLS